MHKKIAVSCLLLFECCVWARCLYAAPLQSVAQQQFQLGLQLRVKRQYRQAIDYFDRAINADPKFAAAYESRAACLMEIEKFDDAMKDANKAIALEGRMAIAYADRAKIFNERNNRKQAIADFSKAIQLSKLKPNASFFQDRGCLYQEDGDDDKAVADFTEGLSLHPHDPWLHYFRACIEFKKEKYKEALSDATESIKSSSANEKGSFYQLRAKCYEKLGQPQLAKKDRETARSAVDLDWGSMQGDKLK